MKIESSSNTVFNLIIVFKSFGYKYSHALRPESSSYSPKSCNIKLPEAFNLFTILQVCSNLAIIFWSYAQN